MHGKNILVAVVLINLGARAYFLPTAFAQKTSKPKAVSSAAGPTIEKKSELDPGRLEVGGLPVLMGDSDLGFGIGGALSLARFAKGYAPFRWQMLAVIFLTMKTNDEGSMETVFHNHLIRLDLPGLIGGKVRLRTELAFARHSNTGYYGIGNGAESLAVPEKRMNQYDRIYPAIDARARVHLAQRLSLMIGGSLTYNWIEIYEGSKLAEDLQSEDTGLREMLHGTHDHLDGLVDVGLIWDSRNHDLVPSQGVFHELSVRFTPDVRSDAAYAGATIALRFYRSIYRDNLVFAVRVMGDYLTGNPPVYELARHGGLFPMPAPGGGSGIRGIPMHRYHGKIKLITNWELRGRLFPFSWFGQRFNVGVLAFVDAGRVWSDSVARKRFDGTDLGLKVGLGGGLRIQWGEAFLLRMDVAWSPDADPVGFYFNIDHVF